MEQLYRHVEHLCALVGIPAMVTESAGFKPSWFELRPRFNSRTVGIAENSIQNAPFWFPETYLGVELRAFRGLDLSAMARVVFNQNAYYSYGELAADTSAVCRLLRPSGGVAGVEHLRRHPYLLVPQPWSC